MKGDWLQLLVVGWITTRALAQCPPPPRPLNTTFQPSSYTVGVLAIRGYDAAIREFQSTFGQYLTATAGARLIGVQFVMKPLNFISLFRDVEQHAVDFLYVNPSAYSCIESEYGSRSLVSQTSVRKVGNQTYHLQNFGGVMLVKNDRRDLQTIHDTKDSIVGAASLSGLGSGQMQFREMLINGLNWINDPKQLVFTSNQELVVNGVLDGSLDVGFVRTDQLERTIDRRTGQLVNASEVRIINIQDDALDFPFASSTPLYPEWNVAALNHVPDEVVRELQAALLAVSDHDELYQQYQTCPTTECQNQVFEGRCDSSLEQAEAAHMAMQNGKYSSWTPTQSYMSLRTMQQDTGFIQLQEDGTWRCLRSMDFYESVLCPEGYLKKSQAQLENGCTDMGLDCPDGHQCICQPCYQPFECTEAVNILGKCVSYDVLMISVLVPVGFLSVFVCLFVWFHKSRQLVKQAKAAAKNERRINEVLAHEVRNPLAAAISACSFIDPVVQGYSPIPKDDRTALQEDVKIVSNALQFCYDLLRSMLDEHRAASDQLVLEEQTVGVLHDILEPVAGMVYSRDAGFSVEVDCPHDLFVYTDRLRTQQIVLNLARNAAKFVENGFVRLSAANVDGNVTIFVMDSGPGIPEEKRAQLFQKYQASLDNVGQGTGVGLSLVSMLADLMEGSVYLDESYHSGVEGCPGACLVINLKKAPATMHLNDESGGSIESPPKLSCTDILDVNAPPEKEQTKQRDFVVHDLPNKLSVLMTDDDQILRKQAARALSRLCPEWTIRVAASGEATLAITANEKFDVIFLDQWMVTGAATALKGTETTRALRARGVKSIICGLSANHLEPEFKKAGSDEFWLKPFPCKPMELKPKLVKLLATRNIKRIGQFTLCASDKTFVSSESVAANGDV